MTISMISDIIENLFGEVDGQDADAIADETIRIHLKSGRQVETLIGFLDMAVLETKSELLSVEDAQGGSVYYFSAGEIEMIEQVR